MKVNRLFLLILIAALSACAGHPVKDAPQFKLDSLTSIQGKQLEANGHFKSPTLVMIYTHIEPDSVEALNRFGDWIMPKLSGLNVAYVGIARGHTAADLKLWQEEDHIALDLVADPDMALTDAFDVPAMPAYIYVNENAQVLFQYSGWSSDIGRTLLNDIKYVQKHSHSINKNALVGEVLKMNRFDKTIDEFPETALSEIDGKKDVLPAGLYDALRANIVNNIDVEEDKETVRRMAAAYLDYGTLNDARKWYSSSTGKKLIALEDDSMDGDMQAKYEAYMKSLQRGDIKRQRVELIEKIDQLTGNSRLAMDFLLDGAFESAVIKNALLPREQQLSLDDIRAYIMSQANTVNANIYKYILSQLLYIYHDATDADLDQYIQYLETESGRRLTAVELKGLRETVKNNNKKVMKNLPAILSKYKDIKGI